MATSQPTPEYGRDEILDLLDEHGGLRVEEVAEETEMDFQEARDVIHDLWDQNLVVSGPNFKFEADREQPPNLA